MATKGQKFKQYNDDKLKMKILNEYISGVSSTYLSKKYNIPRGDNKNMGKKI